MIFSPLIFYISIVFCKSKKLDTSLQDCMLNQKGIKIKTQRAPSLIIHLKERITPF